MDKVVGGFLQFGSSPKSAAPQGQFDKARCRGAEPNFLPFGWLFFQPDRILQTLRKYQYKKWYLLCASLCDPLLHFVVSQHCRATTEIIFS